MMKRLLKSKGFKVTALSVCCVGILAAYFFGRDRDEEFTPDMKVPASTVSEWEEPTGGDKNTGSRYRGI